MGDKTGDPRRIVAQALLRVSQAGAWSNLSLDHALQKHGLGREQSAFAGALFYGVIERRITLDACIAAFSKTPPARLSPAVREVLRIGLYQFLYMDAVPDRAAVDESVKLVRSLGAPWAAGFVNGVLRSFLRAGVRVPLPDGPPAARWSVAYSCPQELVRLWTDSYGEQAALRLLEQSLGRPPLHIRVNTLKTTPRELTALLCKQGVQAQVHPLLPECLVLRHTGAVHALEAYRAGLFHVQDAASQLCVLALDPQPGQRVLDACAAPGGKSFTAAQRMGDRGELLACDLHAKRTALIDRRAGEMGISCIRTRTGDMRERDEVLGLFERVLCDVPCSGLGAIRRKPEIKYKPLEGFAELPNIQYKILENSAQYCCEGGLLIYSTCTLNPVENTGVVKRFLDRHAQFEPVPLPPVLGGGAEYTLLAEHDADGFYIAAMRRRG